MTLDDAIKHAEEVAEEKFDNAVYIMDKTKSDVALSNVKKCRKCAEEHHQLAEWLKELKAYKEQSGDVISRQATINEIARWKGYLDADMIMRIQIGIKRLPSVQPEIIRCKDCKYCKHWYADKGRCFLWHEDGIGIFEDGFCNYAERKTDDLE